MSTKAKILIVEDDTVLAEGLKLTLLELGYAVPEVVSAGEEVFAIAARKKPDLILIDISGQRLNETPFPFLSALQLRVPHLLQT